MGVDDGHVGKRHHGAPLAKTWSPLIEVRPEKLGVPLLTVIVAPVYEVNWRRRGNRCGAVNGQVGAVSVVRSGSSRVPPEVTLSTELLPWSETMRGRDERSNTLPVPLTWKKLRPEGFDARWLRLISPPE